MTDHPGGVVISEDTHQRILTAALRLFEQLGYSQATTRAIAKAAGVNEVTLFRQFGSKKQLLMACIEAKKAYGFSSYILFESIFKDNLTPGYTKDEVILPLVDLFVRGSLAAPEEQLIERNS